MSWCSGQDCADASTHCSDLKNAYMQYQELKAIHSEASKVQLLRLEDLLQNPIKEAKLLFRWAGINWTQRAQHYISSHTSRTIKRRNPYSLYRRPGDHDSWMKSITASNFY